MAIEKGGNPVGNGRVAGVKPAPPPGPLPRHSWGLTGYAGIDPSHPTTNEHMYGMRTFS